MKYIQKSVDIIDEELDSAKSYVSDYLQCKSKGNMVWANRYREMAEDELKHAMYIHDKVVEDIQALEKIYTAPTEMQDEWDRSHKIYVEKVAWIRQMLAL